ncbi:MAG: polyphosphate kinase 1 [Bacteroidetes bacterium]|nr:polyphosphate kinase 1 [Bacteroidota bacterium]
MEVTKNKQGLFIDRDLSWLFFNQRVLQEAQNANVPLIERLKFLGIFSNNLDEFFRVRVASHQRISLLRKTFSLKYNPEIILAQIQEKVLQLQDEFEITYRSLITQLKKQGVEIINETHLTLLEAKEIKSYFKTEVLPHIHPVVLSHKSIFPELNDKSIYLAAHLYKHSNPLNRMYALIELPTKVISRFYTLHSSKKVTRIIMLDDIVRYCLVEVFNIFDYDSYKAYTVKLTRDAELSIVNEGFESMLVKVTKSLKQRSKGKPVRFVFDEHMPDELLKMFVRKFALKDQTLIPGGRYHNFKDFINFPAIKSPKLVYSEIKSIPYIPFDNAQKIVHAIRENDHLIMHPYHTFDYAVRFIREAAIDPQVTEIKISLYRLARNSNIANALISAIKNGKQVTVIMELKARFDEEHNIYWANKMQEAGAKVIFTSPNQKVHCKLCLIKRIEKKKSVYYLQCGTGNYNADTSKIYSDLSLFTVNPKLTKDALEIFKYLTTSNYKPKTNFILTAPFGLREQILKLIDVEIANAKKGKEAFIYAKLNSLSDTVVIERLYKASAAGVKIKLIIRGICCLVPENKLFSKNIECKSIIGRYLEHSRFFIFNNNNDLKVYMSSADWMERNFSSRVESVTPILNKKLKKQVLQIFDFQWSDNVKSRHMDLPNYNKLYEEKGKAKLNSQLALFDLLKNIGEGEVKF